MELDDIIQKHVAEAYAAGANISQVDRALKTRTCCFITAYLDNKKEKENQAAFTNLSKDLQTLGLGHVNLVGHWDGTEERSMFVTMATSSKYTEDTFIDLMKNLMIKYKQVAILLKLKDEKEAFLLYANGTKKLQGVIHHKDLEKIIPMCYSTIKHKAFVFESLENDTLEYFDSVNPTFARAQFFANRKNFLETGEIIHPEPYIKKGE